MPFVYEEVEIEDMEYNPEDYSYSYPVSIGGHLRSCRLQKHTSKE